MFPRAYCASFSFLPLCLCAPWALCLEFHFSALSLDFFFLPILRVSVQMPTPIEGWFARTLRAAPSSALHIPCICSLCILKGMQGRREGTRRVESSQAQTLGSSLHKCKLRLCLTLNASHFFMGSIRRILVPPTELWFGINELIYGKHLKQCLVYGRFSTNISYCYYFYIQCLE